jgi:hypothetical protein
VKWVKTLFWMAIFFFAILFSMQNQEWVTLRLGLYPIENYHWEVPKVPLFLVVLCSIFFGILIGGIGDLYKRFLLKETSSTSENDRKIGERDSISSWPWSGSSFFP